MVIGPEVLRLLQNNKSKRYIYLRSVFHPKKTLADVQFRNLDTTLDCVQVLFTSEYFLEPWMTSCYQNQIKTLLTQDFLESLRQVRQGRLGDGSYSRSSPDWHFYNICTRSDQPFCGNAQRQYLICINFGILPSARESKFLLNESCTFILLFVLNKHLNHNLDLQILLEYGHASCMVTRLNRTCISLFILFILKRFVQKYAN